MQIAKTIAVLLIGSYLLPTTAAQATPEEDAKELADTIRDFNDAFGDVVDGEMTPEQIAQFERMITPAFDPNKIHDGLCSALTYTSVMSAGMVLAASVNPAYQEMAREIESELVPGSLRDWLFRFARSVTRTLGQERSSAAVKHECLQKKYVHAAFPDLDMNSQQMLDEERCLLHQECQPDT